MRHSWRLTDPPPAKGGLWTCDECGHEIPSYGEPVDLIRVHSRETISELERHLDVVCRWREKPSLHGFDLFAAARDGALIPTQVPSDCELAMVRKVMES